MLRFTVFGVLCMLLIAPVGAGARQLAPVTPDSADNWACYTTPLPKQMQISAEVIVPKGAASLEIKGDESRPSYDEIRAEFADICGEPANAAAGVRIAVEVLGQDAELSKLPNSSQAYRISSSDDGSSVTISALGYRGAYYGWQTLKQLIRGRSSGETITIPVLKVTDWPDLEQRGLWGTDSNMRLDWLSERKMNHEEQIMTNGMRPDGTFFAGPRDFHATLAADCARYAVDFAPVVLHLEQVLTEDMVRRYPELKAVKATHERTMCYAQPRTVEMISTWIYDLAKITTDHQVDVWMSENLAGKCGCQCEVCKKEHHTVNEARAVIKAWEMAKKKLGADIPLYMLTSEATENSNPKILAELPKDVRIWYYHSLLTYNTMRRPILRPYLAEAAKNGRWMGVCPSVDAWVHINSPFTGADFIKYRMAEFQQKGFKGLLGYATPRVQFNKFNVEAAAEWTWNLNGRTPEEFAYSYAIREGIKDPAKFTEWSRTLGSVAWDVHGSAWPVGQGKKRPETVMTALKNGTMPPLGFVYGDAYPTPWGSILNEKQLSDDVAKAEKSIGLARDLGRPELMYETLVIDGYIRSLKALYELKKLAPKGGEFALADRAQARVLFEEFFSSMGQAASYLPKWEACVKVAGEDHGFTGKPIALIKEIVRGVRREAADMGVSLPPTADDAADDVSGKDAD